LERKHDLLENYCMQGLKNDIIQDINVKLEESMLFTS
jgi:hypothetical protein